MHAAVRAATQRHRTVKVCAIAQTPSITVPPVCRPRNTVPRIARFLLETQIRWSFVADKVTTGRWIKEQLAALGPAFIKLGQFLSTRPDLLGKEVVGELAKLQDDIAPVHFDAIRLVIEESLGKPMDRVFKSVCPESIASASIGQVHRAILVDGTQVVIKVQKPCVARQIKDDIETLRGMNKFMASCGWPRSPEFENVLHQYDRFLSAELDYRHEMDHMIYFHESLDGLPVQIPRVYKEFSSEELLVMEYVGSTKITHVDEMRKKGIDTSRIAETLIQVFLAQIIGGGTRLHCDPHPGNIGVADDGETIVLYDFGNVIELSPKFRKEINNLVFSIVQRDVDDFVHILTKLEIVIVKDEVEKLEIKEFFRSFFVYLETLDFDTLKTAMVNQEISNGGGSSMQIRIDPDFLSLFRVFSLLDGTCAKLDPNFNYITALQPYAADFFTDASFVQTRMMKDMDKIRTYPMLMKSTDDNILRLHKRVSSMNVTVQRLQALSVVLLLFANHENWWLNIASCGALCAAMWTWSNDKK